jgi:hypothetical protein
MAFSNHDIVPDSPTNNFATLNPLANAGSTFSENNLKISFGNDGSYNPPVETSTFTIPSSGKWYFEGLLVSSTAIGIGIQANTDVKVRRGSADYGIYYLDSGNIYTYVNGSDANVDSSPASCTTGDIIGCAYDANINSISWYKNGVLQTSYTPSTGYDFTFALFAYASTVMANFGQDPTFAGAKSPTTTYTDANGIGSFYYQPPAGAKALCTANLPDFTPTVTGDVPQDYFKTVLWTGQTTGGDMTWDGTTGTVTVGFQPDLVWGKNRDFANDNEWTDSVRGATRSINSNTMGTEGVNSEKLKSFDSNGFSIGNAQGYNKAGDKHVAWCWKAGGASVTNNDGTITSTVSANQDAGFSIVSWTGNGSSGATIGHGLGTAPDCVIMKRRNAATNWPFWNSTFNATTFLFLQSSANAATSENYFNSTLPSSSVLTLSANSEVNASGGTYIAYCWHSVEGYSKFGSYSGNGSTDGSFVYTGFRPAFVMIKNIDASSNWSIFDSARDESNVVGRLSLGNSNVQESDLRSSYYPLDFLSNGFKLRTDVLTGTTNINVSNTYIFMAFAEQPFNYANAR